MELTQERLKESLEYDSATGIFYWKDSRGNVKKHDKAGYLTIAGYRMIAFDNKKFLQLCHQQTGYSIKIIAAGIRTRPMPKIGRKASISITPPQSIGELSPNNTKTIPPSTPWIKPQMPLPINTAPAISLNFWINWRSC